MDRGALDPKGAAEFLNLPVGSIRRLAREGRLPHFKVGRLLRFSVEGLENWMTSQAAASAQPKPEPEDETLPEGAAPRPDIAAKARARWAGKPDEMPTTQFPRGWRIGPNNELLIG